MNLYFYPAYFADISAFRQCCLWNLHDFYEYAKPLFLIEYRDNKTEAHRQGACGKVLLRWGD